MECQLLNFISFIKFNQKLPKIKFQKKKKECFRLISGFNDN